MERIRREAALVKATRKLDDPRTDFLDGFIWPSQGPISGVYGSQRILNGKPRRPHFGVDVAGPVGTPVLAARSGRVMQMAEQFDLPIFTFVDTPGAFPGIGAEERGQAEAIARNLMEMAVLETPIVAVVTGIQTVGDFRRRDIALGGEGAPLVPAFHQAVFRDESEPRVVLNIGGIANVTVLIPGAEVAGFDTGPGNTLMDAWARLKLGQPYDRGGEWAAAASVDEELLEALLLHPFFGRSWPKSTGIEDFNMGWLQGILDDLRQPREPAVIQATLCALTARTAADASSWFVSPAASTAAATRASSRWACSVRPYKASQPPHPTIRRTRSARTWTVTASQIWPSVR